MPQLSAEPDPDRSLGHARIIVDGVGQVPADVSFKLWREGYPTPNLGHRGWQVAEERLKPVAAAVEGGHLVLVVSPAVTRHLEVEPYVFALPSVGVEAPIFWPDTIDIFEGELPAAVEVPPEPALSEYRPPPIANPQAESTQSVEAAPAVQPAPPPPDRVEQSSASADPEPVRNERKLPLIVGGAAGLLILAGAAAWWFVLREPAPPPPAPTLTPPIAQQPQPQPASPLVTPTPAAAASWPDGTDALSLQDVVQRAPNPEGIYNVARRRQTDGKHDDALVLFEEAADRGYAPAMTAVARLYDPNGFVAGRPFRSPDPRAAARFYRDAVRAGDAGAEAPRAALRATLEEQARGGNSTAESALREFWQ